MQNLRLVVIESPYAGNIEENKRYARMCMRDCLMKGEAPIASHLIYTQEGILRDEIPAERKLGMEAGFEWGKKSEASVVYIDRGISSGMIQGIKRAIEDGRMIEFRFLREYISPEYNI